MCTNTSISVCLNERIFVELSFSSSAHSTPPLAVSDVQASWASFFASGNRAALRRLMRLDADYAIARHSHMDASKSIRMQPTALGWYAYQHTAVMQGNKKKNTTIFFLLIFSSLLRLLYLIMLYIF